MKNTCLRLLAVLAVGFTVLPALAARAWVSLGGPGGSVATYRAIGGAPAAQFATPPGATDLLLSPDGTRLLVGTTTNAQNDIPGGAPSLVAVLDAATGAELARHPMPASVVKMVRDATGRRVWATGTRADGTVVVMALDLQTGATAIAPVADTTDFGLYTIGLSADGTTVFVPTRDGLAFIDSASLVQTARLALPSNAIVAPPQATPDGRTLMMTGAGRVYAVDLATRTLRGQRDITTSAAAFGAALSPDGGTFYVSAGTLSAIDVATLSVRGAVNLAQANPFRLGLSPDGRRLFATDLTNATTTVVDAATLTPGAVLQHIAPPYAVATLDDGSALFLHENASALVQVDTATLGAGARFAVGSAPRTAVLSAGKLFVPETANVALQRTPAAPTPAQPLQVNMISPTSAAALGERVYVNSGSEVRVIDARRERVTRTLLLRVPQGGGLGTAIGIAGAGDDTTFLASYVALNFSGAPVAGGLLRVNPATGAQRALSSFPFLPSVVAADRSARFAYATGLLAPGTLGQWDLSNNRFVRSAAMPGGPQFTALAPSADGSLLLAADARGVLYFVTTATLALENTFPAGTRPSGVAVSADGAHAIVTDAGSNRITVFAVGQRSAIGTIDVGAPSSAVMFVD